MHPAQQIRAALARVAELRAAAAGTPALRSALEGVRNFQSRRFAATYADLAADRVTGPATLFFLQELYGGRDYAHRDGQFARVAGTIEQTFPQDVVAATVEVAQLHAISEALDHAMAQAWLDRVTEQGRPDAQLDIDAYVRIWRTVGRRADRQWQLQTVVSVGQALGRLTRKKALGWMLRLMQAPAKAAGMGDLQHFLAMGFDTFGGMAAQPGGVARFLDTIGQREAGWIHALFDDEPGRVQGALAQQLKGLPPAGIHQG